jgi:flagellar biosynthesis/type III secretory pathway protein FliH
LDTENFYRWYTIYFRQARQLTPKPLYANWHSVCRNTENALMTIAQQLEQKGIQKGIEQGIEQGIQLGEQRGIEKGRSEGERQATLKIARTMLQKRH